MASFYPANAPLVNYLFYNYTTTLPGPNLPLSGGKVFFFEDSDHTKAKPTYSDVNNPAAPVINTNPIDLNVVGAMPFFYAEEGLYYIVITGPDGDLNNPIWTFEHVNFAGGEGNSSENVINYIPNGQFLLQNNIVIADGDLPGQISQPITPIAYGKWTFERPADSTAIDIITFERYDEWTSNPSGNPRNAVRIQCTEPDSGDGYKDLRVKFENVNRFASETQEYTVAFNGLNNLPGDTPVSLYLIKNFGTDGSTETQTLLTTFSIDTTTDDYFYSFIFGGNQGQVIGPNDDDFIQLAWRLATDQELDVLLTDFDLQSGNLSKPVYPEETQNQTVRDALAGGMPIPAADGSDLYLPVRLTATGWEFDHSTIGFIYSSSIQIIPVGYLFCNGTKYRVSDYSSDGIPYKRLYNMLVMPNTLSSPRYGTGRDYMTATGLSGNQITVLNNTIGTATPPSDSSIPTHFTFTVGSVSGLQEVTINTTNASTITPGGYFNIYGYNGSSSVAYYFYFIIDGNGDDPSVVGATGIPVNLSSSDTSQEVAAILANVINSTFFCVPDYRGFFIRAWDDGAGRDPDAGTRSSIANVPYFSGDVVGTGESSQNLSHDHDVTITTYSIAASQSGGGVTIDVVNNTVSTNYTTTTSGGAESRPENANAMLLIKY